MGPNICDHGECQPRGHLFALKAGNLLHNGSVGFKKTVDCDKDIRMTKPTSNCNKEKTLCQPLSTDGDDAEACTAHTSHKCEEVEDPYKMFIKKFMGISKNISFDNAINVMQTAPIEKQRVSKNEEPFFGEKVLASNMNGTSEKKEITDTFIASSETAVYPNKESFTAFNKEATASNQNSSQIWNASRQIVTKEETRFCEYPNALFDKSVDRGKENAAIINLTATDNSSTSLEDMAISESSTCSGWAHLCVNLTDFNNKSSSTADSENMHDSHKIENVRSSGTERTAPSQKPTSNNEETTAYEFCIASNANFETPSTSIKTDQSSTTISSDFCGHPIVFKEVTTSIIDSSYGEPKGSNNIESCLTHASSRTEQSDQNQSTISQSSEKLGVCSTKGNTVNPNLFCKDPLDSNKIETCVKQTICGSETSGQIENDCNKIKSKCGTSANSSTQIMTSIKQPVTFSRHLIVLCEKVSGFCGKLLVSKKKAHVDTKDVLPSKKPSSKA